MGAQENTSEAAMRASNDDMKLKLKAKMVTLSCRCVGVFEHVEDNGCIYLASLLKRY